MCNDNNRIQVAGTVADVKIFQSLTVDQLKQDLVDHGPLGVAIDATPEFMQLGPSGIFAGCSSSNYNHAVLLVGYTETHWIIKNSWGTSWGNGGYGYIPINADCGLRGWVDEMIIDGDPYTPDPDPEP